MPSRARLEALIAATRSVVEPLDLAVVLRRIVDAAVDLVGAKYGALGVVAADGGLEAFIHTGMPAATVAEIGGLPQGRGVLGALIDDPRPIRLAHLSDHPRSTGFPARHPSMDGFLGVPIRVREQVYGNLYLTEPARGTFTPEDEHVVTALAATAGFAIANARLFDDATLRQRWTAAAAEITTALVTGSPRDAEALLADELRSRVSADHIFVVRRAGNDRRPSVVQARGAALAPAPATALPEESLTAAVLDGAPACTVNAGRDDPTGGLAIRGSDGESGPVILLPIRTGESTWGVVVAARNPGRPNFSQAESDIGADLGDRIALAIDLGVARDLQERVQLAEDRARIARDLHDHVIQQLFGAGLELQALASTLPDSATERLRTTISALDQSIEHIRTVIFALRIAEHAPATLRHRLLDIAAECSRTLPKPVGVNFAGPLDLVVDDPLADDVAAVVRELLTNAIKHARASDVRLTATAQGGVVTLAVHDNGVGMGAGGEGRGLANLRARAERRGGTFTVESAPGRTVVTWIAQVDGWEAQT